jgi:hypothetical protein
MAGWASSAVGSVTNIGKKGKEKFASLYDDEKKEKDNDEDGSSPKRSSPVEKEKSPIIRRKSSATKATASPAAILLKPRSLQEKKVVRALYDFSGSSDELSFKAGDEILVVNEVLEGWWMGELGGTKGLFPTSYAEVISSKPPSLPFRPDRKERSEDEAGWRSSDAEEDAVWNSKPLSPSHPSPFYGGPIDTASITSVDEDEDERLMPSFSRSATEPPLSRKALEALPSNEQALNGYNSGSSTTKKAPPPPPPRRSTNSFSTASSPPIPSRRPTVPRRPSHSSSGSGSTPLRAGASFTPPSSVSSHEYDTSPFESAADVSNVNGTTGCKEFRQNPFKPKGLCSNCFAYHK